MASENTSVSETETGPSISPEDMDSESILQAPTEADSEVISNFQNFPSGSSSVNKEVEVDLSTSSHYPGVTLTWENISVHSKPPRSHCPRWKSSRGRNEHPSRHILKNVTGVAEPGKLLALMGASGAGKTTLLNVLTQRNQRNVLSTGSVRLNGARIMQSEIGALSGYVEQDDQFIGSLTVREQLKFYAMLRMSRSMTGEQRMNRINELMIELGLMKCANTVIGVPGKVKGLSGGERKRLAFACEALTSPSILFCDEPTSGLDAFMAVNLVKCMRDLGSLGMTIICTIHQPSSQVFALFDRVMFLAEGEVAFLGPTRDAPIFFSSIGYNCPVHFNPADYFIQLLAVVPGEEQKSLKAVTAISEGYKKSVQFQEVLKIVSAYHSTSDPGVERKVQEWKSLPRYKSKVHTELKWLFWRSVLTVIRNPTLLRTRILQGVAVGLLLGLVYLKLDINQKNIASINGIVFLLQSQASLSCIFSVINSFPAEFHVLKRENSSGTYRVFSYCIAKTCAELPLYLFTPMITATIPYYMVGLYHGDNGEVFGCTIGVMSMVGLVAVSFGYMLSSMSSQVDLLLAIAPITIIPLLLFGGLFLNVESTPKYFLWLQALSWFRYSNEIMTTLQWKHIYNIKCDYPNKDSIRDKLGAELNKRFGTVIDPSAIDTMFPPCHMDGDDVLHQISFKESNIAFDLGMLVVLTVSFRLISYLLLALRVARH